MINLQRDGAKAATADPFSLARRHSKQRLPRLPR